MKKQFCSLLLLSLICLLSASCSKNEPAQNGARENLSVNSNTDNNGTEAQDNIAANVVVDVDLTVLSSTMVYAEVYNIMMDPDSYVGKTIKGNGLYNSFYHEEIDRYFHYFVISDATGCCPQGLDFVWNGEHVYPDNYPENGENIEVTGVFIKGEMDGQPHYYLAADDLTILK